METNSQLKLAENLLEYTGTNLFLTGKAGTGKTTFLKNLRLHSPKRMIVVAPTGVAAINAGGVTIHSFFQLPFAPFIPDPDIKRKEDNFSFNRQKRDIIRSIDLLVIDEISMVRADLLDSMDEVLRRIRRNDKPFGGVQLLMIGDLQQLAPVIKEEEWSLLKPYYDSPFFFNSIALRKSEYLSLELKTIYRQSDRHFISLLNKIRENRIDSEMLKYLNSRYIPDFVPAENENYIILTTHNVKAQQINSEKLAGLSSKKYRFTARITDKFPSYSFPTDEILELKEGAQVMFVKNDSSPEKRYFNGKIGIVSVLDEKNIEVICGEETNPIKVGIEKWTNTKYVIDPETREIREEEEGAFEQYPLKPAWAITIHKSQGLTFDRAIIDANAAFAHGQVYVALSRCKTLEGLVLSSPIQYRSVISNKDVNSFIDRIEENQPDEKTLDNLSKRYYVELLFDQFDFNIIFRSLSRIFHLLDTLLERLYPDFYSLYQKTLYRFQEEILIVGDKFANQLQQLVAQSEDYLTDEKINERISKGIDYFLLRLFDLTTPVLSFLEEMEVDNKETGKQLAEMLDVLEKNVKEKQQTLEANKDSFSVSAYLNARAVARLGKVSAENKSRKLKKAAVSSDVLHTELFNQIRSWRQEKAKEKAIKSYQVLTQAALLGVVNLLPTTEKELLRIPGIGKVTAERYGNEIIEIVLQTVSEEDIAKAKQSHVINEESEPKIDTKEVSFSLFREGKTVKEISAIRQLTVQTIERHLVHYLSLGMISLEELVADNVKIERIKNALLDGKGKKLTEIKEELGNEISWGDLHFVLAAIKKA